MNSLFDPSYVQVRVTMKPGTAQGMMLKGGGGEGGFEKEKLTKIL